MKVAIITQPLRTNYGGILQNYALQMILKSMGHSPTTLQCDECVHVQYPRYILTLIKRLLLKALGKYNSPIFYEKKYMEDYPVFTKHTLGFVKRYINVRVVDIAHPAIAESDYDAYVVGSDQVWRPLYNNIDFTFLSFSKRWNVKRCAYAASFGTDDWEFSKEDTEKCKALASMFNAVSVREKSGVSLCKKYLNVNALLVLDPTLLLHRSDYEKLIDNAKTSSSSGQILVHVLDKNADKSRLVEIIAKQNRWIPFEVNCKVDEHELNEPVEKRTQPPVEQWLRAFKEAEFVVTDSFHATVFSIIFNKPFVVYANRERGAARFLSLLSLFHLEDRLVYKSTDFDKNKIGIIDYGNVNAKIDTLRDFSLNFLVKGLK